MAFITCYSMHPNGASTASIWAGSPTDSYATTGGPFNDHYKSVETYVNNARLRFPNDTTITEGGMAFWYYRSPYNEQDLYFDAQTAGSDRAWRVWWDDSASTIYLYDANNAQVWSGAYSWPSQTWQFVEFKWKLHGSTGYVEMRIDEAFIFAKTGIDTSHTNGDPVEMAFSAGGANDGVRLNGVLFYDVTGTGITDHPGPFRAYHLALTSDAEQNWTPSTGTAHYEVVNDRSATDYLTATAASTRDRMGGETYDGPSANILGVVAYASSGVVDPGVSVKVGFKESGGTESLSAARTAGGAVHTHGMPTKPSGGAWDATTINGGTFVLESA